MLSVGAVKEEEGSSRRMVLSLIQPTFIVHRFSTFNLPGYLGHQENCVSSTGICAARGQIPDSALKVVGAPYVFDLI